MEMNDTRLPPNDNEAEESVIGSLLINGDAIALVENKIKPVDFYFDINQWIFQACMNLRSRRENISEITLGQELSRIGKLEACGGRGKLIYYVSVPPTSNDIEYYADIVYRLSVSRQMIALGDKVSRIGYSSEPDVPQTVSKLSDTFNDFKKSIITYSELVSPKDVSNLIFDMGDENKRPHKIASWGFRDLDEITGGIFPELVIVGARPSVGKTQIMLDILQNVAAQGKKALFCSAEMSIRALMERKIARELKTDIKLLRHDTLSDETIDALTELAGRVSEEQVWYLPQGSSSQDIYNEAVKLKDNIGLDIVFVDYLQILKDCWQSGKENKTTLVGRASKTLKSLVNDLNIPVICASQLNRDIERRTSDNSKPMLADLRESGDIEQDADVVFLLWRDMNNINTNVRNILELKMAKNRQLGDAPAQQLVWLSEEHRYADGFRNELNEICK
jgi:replicative DNA helicase